MIYFDNGATTFPKPINVINAVNRTLRNYGANPGRSGHNMSLKASEIIYNTRVNVAKLFDIYEPENVIFTHNCTTALNVVIKGLLNKGDHAVISSLEHNAVLRPLEFMRASGVEYSVADYDENEEKFIDNFRKAFRSNTKLVICTHASNVFGIKLPIEKISALCRVYGILFCLDAAQSAGIIPISLNNSCIDFLCTAGHKGLYGPMGTGILIINNKNHPESLIQGGTGSVSISKYQPEILPDRYESGTPNLSGIAGLNEGVKFILKKDISKISKKEIQLIQMLYDGLSSVDDIVLYTKRPSTEKNVSVLSFNIKGFDSEEIAMDLNDKFNIAVRSGLHCAPMAHKTFNTDNTGTVRVVVSIFTNTNQINYFINSIKKICYFKKHRKKVAIDN